MAIGVVHDLAVGVDPEGADAWALQDVLATGVTVGAPPDAFNRRGQDWGLPPWLLAEGSDQDEDAVVVAMHALLARSPCRLRLVSPYDLIGEARQPNLPGTVDEYPNWRLPLPITLEQLRSAPLVARMVSVMLEAGTVQGG